jgi:hypothetical protein
MSAEATEREGSALWRILTTPIGPPILPRIRRRPGPAAIIAAADLPAVVSDLVARVVRRTRLWRRERADVAAELCSHFAEGLAAGRSGSELIEAFGDPIVAARLIREAKRRQRSWLWHVSRGAVRAMAALVLITAIGYGVLAARYYLGAPAITHDFVSPLVSSAASDGAWPLYRDAISRQPRTPEELRGPWGWTLPGDPQWPAALDYLRSAQDSIELIHAAAAKPALGVDWRVPQPDLNPISRAAPPSSAPVIESAFEGLHFEYLYGLQRSAALLREDAYRAAVEGDAAGVAHDLIDLLAVAAHARQGPLLINDSQCYSLFSNSAIDVLLHLLAERPDLLPRESLVDVAHRIATFAGGGHLGLRMQGERAYFLDLVQRTYTDDGGGNGRLTPQGAAYVASIVDRSRRPDALWRRLGPPVLGAAAPSRRQTIDTYDRAMTAAADAMARPFHERTVDPGTAALEIVESDRNWLSVARVSVPALHQLSHQAEVTTARRDAALVVIALELYKHEHGMYPDSLGALVPRLLPAVPIDCFDGRGMKYRLVEDRPILYSVGVDRKDDGGVSPPGRYGNSQANGWIAPQQVQALTAARQQAPGLGGDWVLFPPVDYDPEGDRLTRHWPGTAGNDPAHRD